MTWPISRSALSFNLLSGTPSTGLVTSLFGCFTNIQTDSELIFGGKFSLQSAE